MRVSGAAARVSVIPRHEPPDRAPRASHRRAVGGVRVVARVEDGLRKAERVVDRDLVARARHADHLNERRLEARLGLPLEQARLERLHVPVVHPVELSVDGRDAAHAQARDPVDERLPRVSQLAETARDEQRAVRVASAAVAAARPVLVEVRLEQVLWDPVHVGEAAAHVAAHHHVAEAELGERHRAPPTPPHAEHRADQEGRVADRGRQLGGWVRHAHGRGQDQPVDVLRVPLRVGDGEVPADRVSQQHHPVNLHALPPALEPADEELLHLCDVGRLALRQPPARPARQAAAERVERKHAAAPPPDDRRHRAKVQARAKAVPVQAHERRSLRPLLLAALGKVLDGVDVRAVAVVQRDVERRVRDGSATLIAPPPDAMVEQRELRLAEGAAHRALA
eukprot:CAMPEP_0196688884 /NCGR_PEP_ID=MMETSP1090-20130531/17554_1 /TAXON_ID=37098 /ORGANISM="Isochrysis sp, Strain CCMP1244" /LENGTH=395 /DNA_ID=CAMNT_0042027845 /DNA_START=149 /DNA_END=1336 /DNA_ORIENTATION=-